LRPLEGICEGLAQKDWISWTACFVLLAASSGFSMAFKNAAVFLRVFPNQVRDTPAIRSNFYTFCQVHLKLQISLFRKAPVPKSLWLIGLSGLADSDFERVLEVEGGTFAGQLDAESKANT
jgi:hypothetical protein